MTPVATQPPTMPEPRAPARRERSTPAGPTAAARQGLPEKLEAVLRAHFQSQDLLRRGICLLNLGELDRARETLQEACRIAPPGRSPASCVISALRQRGDGGGARELAALELQKHPTDSTARIRLAWLHQEQGRGEEALALLRQGIQMNPEDAELQFQLGLMLAAGETFEEAEMRFTQAVSIDRSRADGWLHLGLCQGAAGRAGDAVHSLQKAQRLQPDDPQTALLLTQAQRAARDQGAEVHRAAALPSAETANGEDVKELGRLIAKEPEFIDALLSVQVGEQDRRVLSLVLATLHRALEHDPQRADLHFHCGEVLARLGDVGAAIESGERAVDLDPGHVRALINLARWYRAVRRLSEATVRLERVVLAGCEYADVYCELGALYREQGQIEKAATAYRRALSINTDYSQARTALAALGA